MADERLQGAGWERVTDGEWRIEVDDGRLIGRISRVSDDFEARVLRRPTGPTAGPDPVEAHGPQVFEELDEAIDYVSTNLGTTG